jgi:MFS family permease
MLGYIGLIWFADAMELMMLSFIGPAVRGEFALDATSESILTSCVFVGMILGSSFWGALADTRGRRPAFLYTALSSAALAYLSALAPNFWILVALRTLLGIGLAGTTVGDTLFLEVMPKSQRGRWMMALGLFWTLGSISEAALAWGLLSDYGWRVLLAVSATPLALLLLLFPLLPESPRFLLVKGRVQESLEVLERIAKTNGKTLPSGTLRASDQEAAIKLPSQSGILQSGLGGVASAARQLASDMASTASRLMAPQLQRTTLLLASTWLLNMMGYYGVVLLATEIHLSPTDASNVASSTIGLTSEDFKNILVTSIGELPALFVALAGMELIGRRATVAAALGGCALATALLVTDPTGSSFTALMFTGRLMIAVAFNTLMIYTKVLISTDIFLLFDNSHSPWQELFPTSLRSLGLGKCLRI